MNKKTSSISGITEVTQSIGKINNIVKTAIGLSPILRITEAVQKIDKVKQSFENLFGQDAFLRGLESVQKFDKANQIVLKAIGAFGATGIIESIQKTNKVNQSFGNLFGQDAFLRGLESVQKFDKANQIVLKALAQTKTVSSFNEINLDITKETLNQSSYITQKDLEEFEIAIIDKVKQTFQSSSITQKDLEEFETAIIDKTANLLKKNRTQIYNFIMFLIAVIGLTLTTYSTYQQYTDKSNNEVIETINDIRKEFIDINKESNQQILTELQKLTKTYVALTNVNLRYSPKKKGEKIGLVKKGQVVTVIQIHHKFLYITYLDFETGEPKAGFVVKKYFDKEK